MTLRLRLTFLYTTLLGGVFLVFGALVYSLVSLILLDQIDNTLSHAANQLTNQLQINNLNQFDPRSVSNIQFTDNQYFQVWGNNHELQLARPAGLQAPLDETGQHSGRLFFNSSQIGDIHLRVLSVPLETARGPAGVLQVAMNLSILDAAQQIMATVLVTIAFTSMLLVSLIVWLVNGRALARLATVTQTATNITHADDLSRRIPLNHPKEDEVGKLIQAFNQTLERMEKLFLSQRRFLTDVSHELRTPLTVIKGNVGLMQRIGETDSESLESIDAEVDRLTRLVNDLLLLAQAESGRLPMDIIPLELDTILLEVFQQMHLLAGDKLKLQLVEIDQVHVNGDHDRIKQVLLNLIGNAIRYTPAGGQVQLALRKSNDKAQFVISDTGPGIPADDIDHIFERFYRAEKSRKRDKNSGFGLGLSIAYWIIHNHGGSIDVASEDGKGTKFTVWLPLSKETEGVGASFMRNDWKANI